MDTGRLSPDMFDDDEDQAPATSCEVRQSWIGTPLSDIYHNTNIFNWNPPPIKPSSNHTVMFSLPIPESGPPDPFVSNESFCWDSNYVRMPFSPKNLYPAVDAQGGTILKNRWSLIREALSKPIHSSTEFEERILSYNNKYGGKFKALHHYFNSMDEEANTYFFENILPKIISLALKLPELLPSSLPLLKRGRSKTISLTQIQIGSLLANAFLCTFPRRNTNKPQAEYSNYPDINFNRFFKAYERNDETFSEKMKCIINYFRRVVTKPPEGVVTFQRVFFHHTELPDWEKSELPLSSIQLHLDDTGTIDENGLGLLQVDFANKFIGGGVLGLGCVQEEIRFMVCTELIVTRLFTEVLGPTEALIITGVEQYNKSRGYADTFEWVGNCEDKTPRDEFRRVKCYLVAIDALYFHSQKDQYNVTNLRRELNKAYVGYYSPKGSMIPAVATGNWGCGAFRGDPYLKSLLQLMACRVASRDMVYYTFGDAVLRKRFYEMFMMIVQHNGTVGSLFQHLKQFCESGLPGKQLYDFLEKKIISKNLNSLPKRRKLSDKEAEELVMDDIVFSDNDCEFSDIISDITLKSSVSKEKVSSQKMNDVSLRIPSQKMEETPDKSILLEKLQKMEASRSINETDEMDVDVKIEESEKKAKRKISDYFKK